LAADPAYADITVGRGTEFAPAGKSKFGNSVMTFILEASRDADALTTFRLSAAAASAKAEALMKEGWQVVITGPDGTRYRPFEFDRLALSAFVSD
jgi:hypothetical protein